MENKFIWSHGPLSIELKELNGVATDHKKIETFELEDIKYELLVHTEFEEGASTKKVTVTDFPQIIYVEDSIKKLTSLVDPRHQGCLIDSDIVTIPPTTGVITSFRERYLNTILLEDEDVSEHFIRLERNDYNFKFSADEPIQSKTTYNLSIGFPNPQHFNISENISITGLSLDEILTFSKFVSSFLNNIKNKTA